MLCVSVLAINALLAPVNGLSAAASAQQKLDLPGEPNLARHQERTIHVGPDSVSVLSDYIAKSNCQVREWTGIQEYQVVTDAQQFLKAVRGGAVHVEIRSHLDLTAIEGLTEAGWSTMGYEEAVFISFLPPSIQGNCMEQPSSEHLNLTGSNLLNDWKPGQCVIVTDIALFSISQNMWIDNLYFRYKHTQRSSTNKLIFAASKSCNLWMTNVTIQGDGYDDPTWGALSIEGAQVYAEDLIIIDYSTQGTPLLVRNGATVTVANSQFSRITISDEYEASAVLSVTAVTSKSPFAVQQPTILRLESTALSDNKASNELSRVEGLYWPLLNAQIYSDRKREVKYLADPPAGVNTELFQKTMTTTSSEEVLVLKEPVISQAATLPLEQVPVDRLGIDASSAWFVNIQQVVSEHRG